MAWTLVKAHWQIPLAAGALAFAGIQWHRHNVAEQDRGMWQERARVADSTLKHVVPLAAKAETLLVHDTVRLTKTVALERVSHDTVLQHLTDTLLVKTALAQDTAALASCVETVSHCAATVQLKDQEIAALNIKLRASVQMTSVEHWYTGRLTAGPCAGVDIHGKTFAGVCGSVALLRWP